MRGPPILAAALLGLAAAPLAARNQPPEEAEAMLAAKAFMQAIGSEDKTALADHLIPEATIFVHDRIDPANPEVAIIPAADHLARWAKSTRRVSEDMAMELVLVEGDMAQIWGPYAFRVDGEISHCGINSLSLVKREGKWMVGNTSFTMEPPDRCAEIGAPGLGA